MFSAKFRSKYEVYQFLTIDVCAVLPPHECVNIYFLKDLVMGKKKGLDGFQEILESAST